VAPKRSQEFTKYCHCGFVKVKLFHPYGKSELIDEYSFNAAMEPAIL
jgi:hypothetical protein